MLKYGKGKSVQVRPSFGLSMYLCIERLCFLQTFQNFRKQVGTFNDKYVYVLDA